MFKFFSVIPIAAALLAQDVDRTKPPATPPIPSYKLPPIYETKGPNGLNVTLVEDSRFPLITMRLGFQAGSKFDPKDLPGLSEAVASLLNEGTKTRTSRQIAEQVDALGGSLSGQSNPDGLTIAASGLSENTAKLMELLADVALNANFPEKEIELHRQNRKQALRAQRSQPGFLAAEKTAETLYGSHPYAHIAPTVESLDRIGQKELITFRDTYLAPNNAYLVLIGKLPQRNEAMKLVNQYFGSWQQKPVPGPPAAEYPAPKRQIVLVDRPGSVQADIHVARVAVTRQHPDFFPLMVGNTVLGGGTNSRMFREIREKQGFAYDAHSETDTKRDAGSAQAVTQVRNEVLEPAIKAVLQELDKMASDRVSASELSNVKNYLSGMFVMRLETQDGLATQLNALQTLGVPYSYLETYTSRVRATEPDQIQSVSKKYLAPQESAIVVVGDASKIAEALKKFGEVTVTKVP